MIFDAVCSVFSPLVIPSSRRSWISSRVEVSVKAGDVSLLPVFFFFFGIYATLVPC